MLRIKMHYNRRESTKTGAGATKEGGQRKSFSSFRKPSVRDSIDPATAVQKAYARRVSTVTVPTRIQNMRHLSVHAMIFLLTRPFSMHVGQNISISTVYITL